MYAITATSYRAISDSADLQTGETAVDALPQSLLDSMAAAETLRAANARTLEAQALAALGLLRAFRDNPSPDNAQVLAQVQLLTKIDIMLIRKLLGRLDGTD